MKPTLAVLTLSILTLPCLAEDQAPVIYAKRFNEDHVALFNPQTGETKLGRYKERDEDSGWVYTAERTSFYKASDSGNGGYLYGNGGTRKVVDSQNGKLTDPD